MRKRKTVDAILLHVAYPHRWGPGKIHISGAPYRDTVCRYFVHGEPKAGKLSDVTCKSCLKMVLE